MRPAPESKIQMVIMNAGIPSSLLFLSAFVLLGACSAPPAPSPPNERPIAAAGPDQNVTNETTVTVSGAESSDLETTALGFNWSAAVENPTPVIFPSDQVGFNFTPTVAGTYIFILEVSDDELTSLPDSVRISVSGDNNTAPVADAGPDLIVAAGTSVPLSALSSSDANGDLLSYSWSVVSAPDSLQLSDSTSAQPRFTAVVSGEYRFRLHVSDGELSDEDEVRILVRAADGQAPIADAGPDQQVVVGSLIGLDGTQSSDPDGDAVALSYRWSVGRAPSGAVALSDTTAAQPTFIGSESGEYV